MTFIQQYKTLTTIDEFDPSNLVFDKPRDEEVAGNKNIKGKRIKIGILKNGKVCELIIPTEKLYSHTGVSVTEPFGKKGSGEIIGYNIPISLYSRENNLNDRDRKFVKIFREIIDKSKEHLVSNKKQIGKPHITKEFLWRWDNMLYEKKDDETNEPINDYGPLFYAKLMYSRDKGTLATKLVDPRGNPLKLDDVVNKSCNIISCVKFESIYINSNGESLQVKLTEAIVDIKTSDNANNLMLSAYLQNDDDEPIEDENTNLLNPAPVSTPREEIDVSESNEVPTYDLVISDNTDEEIEVEVVEEVEEVEEEPQNKRKPIKKITKK